MIPKVIHYCWVGGAPKPRSVLYCIESWKKHCPGYEIKEWNESNYDFTSNIYMKQAYENKKWGFVPDYARLDIVYKHGGIYFDTDVELVKNIDHLLDQKAFFGFENTGNGEYYVNCGHGFGAEAGHEVIRDLRDRYDDAGFINKDGSLNMLPSPHYTTESLMKYGLIRKDQDQKIQDFMVFASDVFCPKNFKTGQIKKTSRTVSIHHFTASWLDEKVKKEIQHNRNVYRIWGKDLGYRILIAESVLEKYSITEMPKKIAEKSLGNTKKLLIRLMEESKYTLGLLEGRLQKGGTQKIALLDTALDSDNLGDQIIMENCEEQLKTVLSLNDTGHYPTHRFLNKKEKEELKDSGVKILCGTNLLSGRIRQYGLWKIGTDLTPFKNTVLMGVGFDSENETYDWYTSLFYKTILSKDYLHSVRDRFSEKMLKKMGIKNVIYTGCPTMWELTKEVCDSVPATMGKKCVCTLTDYNRNAVMDQKMIQILLDNYDIILFWPQGKEDVEYLTELGFADKVTVLPGALKDYDDVLSSSDTDYIGTRLHAGIRAIRKGRRSIVIEIDNRAECISRDTGLCTVKRDDIPLKLEAMICSSFKTRLELPWESIEKWKTQFY